MYEVDTHDRAGESAIGREVGTAPKEHPVRPRWGRVLFGLGAFLLLAGGLAFGASRSYSQQRVVMATAEQIRNFLPSVRVAIVQPSDATVLVTLPATTSAFSVANMFARASGYIDKRYVDIGDRVKEGQLLAEIVAPELDHQIAQAEATLGQLRAAVEQAQANKNLAQVTWDRDKGLVEKGWVTPQQGDIDRFTLNAREAAVGVAQANVAAQQAQLNVLYQQKAYQRVVAPFDGVVTQRNIDVGDLVHADTTTGTFMFTIMQSNVIRAQVFVPPDSAFGLGPGVDAVVRVPEIPDRTFPGKVARIADALQPGTRTLLTEVDIPNPDGTLTAGVYCTIELRVPRKTPSLLVPADAIIFNRNGLQVAVIEDGTAHIRKVSVTRDLGTQVEVGDGVKQGDQVIVNPPVSLVEGSKVRARAESATPRT
ncbi:MAG: efflux RND transporter periplasmic adaptor subunit [Hyphomicrobiales bacterium]|nr:efflux RND transporter periplasmic adaptor subunit [Hyphomicrobiales bacterium]